MCVCGTAEYLHLYNMSMHAVLIFELNRQYKGYRIYVSTPEPLRFIDKRINLTILSDLQQNKYNKYVSGRPRRRDCVSARAGRESHKAVQQNDDIVKRKPKTRQYNIAYIKKTLAKRATILRNTKNKKSLQTIIEPLRATRHLQLPYSRNLILNNRAVPLWFDVRGKRYFYKILLYDVLVSLNHSDEFFGPY